MMRFSLGELRFLLSEMQKEMKKLEENGVVTHKTVLQFEYFRTTLDKKAVEMLNSKKTSTVWKDL